VIVMSITYAQSNNAVSKGTRADPLNSAPNGTRTDSSNGAPYRDIPRTWDRLIKAIFTFLKNNLATLRAVHTVTCKDTDSLGENKDYRFAA